MTYLILGIICLTVGTPNWTVALCFVCFGVCIFKAFVDASKKDN